MRYTILFAVAFALATNTARAMNSFYYECGDDTEVALAIAKDTGKVLGTNVWIKIRLRVASTNKSLAQSNKENCSGCDGYHRNLIRPGRCSIMHGNKTDSTRPSCGVRERQSRR